jgi:hypothetical protein
VFWLWLRILYSLSLMKKDNKSSKNTKKNKTNKTVKRYPKKYIPSYLSESNARTLKEEIDKSQLFYHKKNPKYYIRRSVKTMKIKPSKHVLNAKKLYKISNMTINKELSRKTGCSIQGLNEIMRKGQGAYFTGSRPGQTPTSWGYARLASSITGGKSSAVDFHILESHCNHKTSKAYSLALKTKAKHGKGTRKVPKRLI